MKKAGVREDHPIHSHKKKICCCCVSTPLAMAFAFWFYLNGNGRFLRAFEPTPRCLAISEVHSSGTCESTDTGGSCYIFGCNAARGHMTECLRGKCVCRQGACARNGACSVPRPCACDTGHTCGNGNSTCDGLGATNCINGICECMEGHCLDAATGQCAPQSEANGSEAVAGRDFYAPDSSCDVHTGDSCFEHCAWRRGPASCIDNVCTCRRGYCSWNGMCSLAVRAQAMNESVDDGSVYARVYPVNNPARPNFPAPHNQVTTALCFSGGGSRSLSTTLGALRALEDLGLMAGVDALSAVSGGTWATAAYMFADLSTEILLRTGHGERPSNLTMLRLNDAHSTPKLGQADMDSMDEFFSRIAASRPPPEELWREFIARTILQPLNLDSRVKMMAGSQEQVDAILRNNPFLQNNSFQIPVPNRPKVYVMGATVLAPQGFLQQASGIASLQISPDIAGTPFFTQGNKTSYAESDSGSAASQEMWVGGGFVETFALGSQAPYIQDQGGLQRILMPDQAFTVADAVGMSSAAFASQMAGLSGYIAGVGANLDPTLPLWPVLRPGEERQEAQYVRIGDGGNSENGGFLAMLQRQASKIVYFMNTDTPVAATATFDFCHADQATASPIGHVTNQLYDKFGYGTDNAGSGFLSHNVVFDRGDMWALVCELQTLRDAGRPAVVKKTHTVLRNEWWGLEGGNSVDVLWVYNDRCQDFEDLLPADTKHQLEGAYEGHGGPFNHFPNYHTVFQHMPEFTALTPAQINLLAGQAEYIVHEKQALFAEFFGGGGAAADVSA